MMGYTTKVKRVERENVSNKYIPPQKRINNLCNDIVSKMHLGEKREHSNKFIDKSRLIIDEILNSPSNRNLIDNEAKNIVNTILKKKRRKCCGGIILNIDDIKGTIYVLVVLGRMSKKWGLPKGGLEEEETYEECALREIKEETGLTYSLCDFKERIKIHSTYYFVINKDDRKIERGPIDTREIAAIKWLRLTDIKKLSEKNLLNRELRDLCNKLKSKIKRCLPEQKRHKIVMSF